MVRMSLGKRSVVLQWWWHVLPKPVPSDGTLSPWSYAISLEWHLFLRNVSLHIPDRRTVSKVDAFIRIVFLGRYKFASRTRLAHIRCSSTESCLPNERHKTSSPEPCPTDKDQQLDDHDRGVCSLGVLRPFPLNGSDSHDAHGNGISTREVRSYGVDEPAQGMHREQATVVHTR